MNFNTPTDVLATGEPGKSNVSHDTTREVHIRVQFL